MHRFNGSPDIIDQTIILGKVDAGDVPSLFGVPACHAADQRGHRRERDADRPFLLVSRLRERHRIGGILLTGTDAKLLLLLQIKELDNNTDIK